MGVPLLLLPLLVDSAAFGVLLLSGSAPLYRAVVTGTDAIFILLFLFTLPSSVRIFREGRWVTTIGIPAGLALAAFLAQAATGAGNMVYIGAFLRYLAWLSVLVVYSRHRAELGAGGMDLAQLKLAIAVIFTLCMLQLLLHPIWVGSLGDIHAAIMEDGQLDAVLTNIGLERNFASLTVRNPIEVGFIGLALLVLAISYELPLVWALMAVGIVAAGRSNSSLVIAAFLVLRYLSKAITLDKTERNALMAVVSGAVVLFVWNFPRIYLGPDATYEDLVLTLSLQRLGMLVGAPALAAGMTVRELLFGLSQPLEGAVGDLLGAGILPGMFSDGGFIAVFDVVWIGMLLVGGLTYVAAGAAFLFAMGRLSAGKGRTGSDSGACRLFMFVMIALSFVAQVFLSRYTLYISCFFMARAMCTGSTEEKRCAC